MPLRGFFFADNDQGGLNFLPIGGKIDIECDPVYDPVTFVKTVMTWSITKTSRRKCDVQMTGYIEVPPNFQGAISGVPVQFLQDSPCPTNPCKT